jgi:hypothetical protein
MDNLSRCIFVPTPDNQKLRLIISPAGVEGLKETLTAAGSVGKVEWEEEKKENLS